jgi:sulfide dehydrogenase cytochrome subunit
VKITIKTTVFVSVALITLSTWVASEPLPVRSMAAACAGCHGTGGIAQQGMASLASRPKDVLLTKLLDFKSGAAPATIMHQLAKGYSDEQLEQLADYFSGLKIQGGQP